MFIFQNTNGEILCAKEVSIQNDDTFYQNLSFCNINTIRGCVVICNNEKAANEAFNHLIESGYHDFQIKALLLVDWE